MSGGFTIMNVEVPVGSNYVITGPDCQILSVSLKGGEKLTCEPGSMMFMSPGVKATTECGSCSRMCAGEALCKVIYENTSGPDGYISVTPNFPAKVIPIHLPDFSNKIITKKGAYMSSVGDSAVDANFDCNCLTSSFGGMGCIRQQVTGTGTAFLAAGGTVVIKELAADEKIVIDFDSVVGFEHTTKLGVRFSGGPMTCCFGGEGCLVNTLQGPGKVILQSMSFGKFKAAVQPPKQSNEGAGDVDVGGAN
jgi:uncharacterized protein (AIM24 family)